MAIVQRWAPAPSVDGPIVVLDRDGVVVQNVPDAVARTSEPPLLPGAVEAVDVLSHCGARVVVVTNQARVGRGLLSLNDAIDTTHSVLHRLDPDRTKIHGFSLCPHTPSDGCDCRKPQVAGVRTLLSFLKWSDDPQWVIGDKLTDIECGHRLGASSILVGTGHGGAEKILALHCGPRPEFYAPDVHKAAILIARCIGATR